MNVIPNAFLSSSSPILTANVASVTPNNSGHPTIILKAGNNHHNSTTITAIAANFAKDRSPTKCVVCQEVIGDGPVATDPSSPAAYQMLAVRPSIGTPAGPFFPILETLTSTSAVRVCCCSVCAQSLLNQWNEYESKNVSIKNRVYNLSAKFSQCLSTTANTNSLSNKNSRSHHPSQVQVNNGTSTGTSAQSKDSQDCVLDLSMGSTISSTSSKPLLSQQQLSSIISSPTLLNLSTNTGIRSQAVRPVTSDISASIPPFFSNSSMTNLIKVSSNPVNLLNSHQAKSTVQMDNNNISGSSTPKKSHFSCSLCDESCSQLLSVLIRPLGNCPYFPTLIPYLKSLQTADGTGKIGTCESCHRQLIQQWDVFQKSNIPIGERHYQLVRASNPNQVLTFPLDSASALMSSINSSSGSNHSRSASAAHPSSHHIPIAVISSNNSTQLPATISKSLFVCVVCSKDILHMASSSNNSAAHVAFSILSENDTSSSLNNSSMILAPVKKLIVQSAQEINVLPFLSNNYPPMQKHQLQMLNENGRVLVCFVCFETFASRCTNNNSSNNNSNSNINNNNNHHHHNLLESTVLKTANRSIQDSLNGSLTRSSSMESHSELTAIGASSASSSSNVALTDLMCLACGHNKAQYMVETKESTNSIKKPFFPFLRDPTEREGRSRICGACQLILETQWDAFEAAYIPYSQRNYRLPSSATSQNNLLLPKRPPSNNSSSSLSSSGLNLAHSNGQQPTPPPLKIQISSPSILQPMSSSSSQSHNSTDCLLLATVNQSTSQHLAHSQLGQSASAAAQSQSQSTASATSSSVVSDNERIFKLIDEFLSTLGGPHSNLSGNCSICNEFSPNGSTYQIFSASQKILLSPELGLFPYFPMLKTNNNQSNKKSKNLSESSVHLACIFCYHSLIAQWAVYHRSSYPEDRDPNLRIYNCQDFICYICGVTTYRPLVRSIKIKDFPFLLEHKRPPGALSLSKSESVVTCLNCFETLTHQWIESERMKVPLEMRKYNWMAVPPPPPPSKLESIDIKPSHSELSRSSHYSAYPPSNLSNSHNGLTISFTPSNTGNKLSSVYSATNDNSGSRLSTGQQPTVVFNPSHTLAPLVAAAMAATPVNTSQIKHHEPTAQQQQATTVTIVESANSIVNSTNSFADALRHLARQQNILQKNESQQQQSNLILHSNSSNHHHLINNQTSSANNSINLSTLASVAALAGNHHNHHHHRSVAAINSTTDNYILASNASSTQQHLYSSQQHKSGALLLNIDTNNSANFKHLNNLEIKLLNVDQSNNNGLAMTNSNKRQLHNNISNAQHFHINKSLKSNNHERIPNLNSHQQQVFNNNNRVSVVVESQQPPQDNSESHYERCLSKVYLEETKLRNKRLARALVRMNSNDQQQQQHSMDNMSDLSDEELAEIGCGEDNMNDDEDEDDIDSLEGYCSMDELNGMNGTRIRRRRQRSNNPPESLLKFIEIVLPKLELDTSSPKLEFMSTLGLVTHQRKRELELTHFISNKQHRRLTEDSFKLKMIDDEDNILEFDPCYRKSSLIDSKFSRLDSSDVMPNSMLLDGKNQNVNGEEEVEESIDKLDFMKAINLISYKSENNAIKQLQTELNWISIIHDIRPPSTTVIRRTGSKITFNNLSDRVLKSWLPQLALEALPSSSSSSSSSSDQLTKNLEQQLQESLTLISSLTKTFKTPDQSPSNNNNTKNDNNESYNNKNSATINNKTITINNNNNNKMDQLQSDLCLETSNNNSNPNNNNTTNSSVTNDNNNSIAVITMTPNNNNNNNNDHHAHLNNNNSHNSNTNNNSLISNNLNQSNSNKIINCKQFAQEFHESVLLETQKQMMSSRQAAAAAAASSSSTLASSSKIPNSAISASSSTSDSHHHNHHHHHNNHHHKHHHHLSIIGNHNNNINSNNAQNHHKIIYSHQHQQQQQLRPDLQNSQLERANNNNNNGPIKFQDKMFLQDQIFKLQERLTEIGSESRYLTEKKNEIEASLQKLESERVSCKFELDRLSKCIF